MTKKYKFTYTELQISKDGILVDWGVENFGFGQFIIQVFNGRLDIQSECMSAEFVSQLLIEIAPKLGKLLIEYEQNNPQTEEEINNHINSLKSIGD